MTKIHCGEVKLVALKDIKLNSLNRNSHPPEQIAQLAKIISYNGFRMPGTISNQSGILIAGEGRYLAAKELGMKKMPVFFQDFDSLEHEYAHGIADNALQRQAILDMSAINEDIGPLGPEFDIDMLGIKEFKIDVSERALLHEVNHGDENAEWVDMPEFEESQKYIYLSFQFSTELQRDLYVKDNNIEIFRKMANQWIVKK